MKTKKLSTKEGKLSKSDALTANSFYGREPHPLQKMLSQLKASSVSLLCFMADLHKAIMDDGSIGSILCSNFPSARLFINANGQFPKGKWTFVVIPFPVLWKFVFPRDKFDSQLITRVCVNYQGYYFSNDLPDDAEAVKLCNSLLECKLSHSYANIVRVGDLSYRDALTICKYGRPILSVTKRLYTAYVDADVFNRAESAACRWFLKREQVVRIPQILGNDIQEDVITSYLTQSLPPDLNLEKEPFNTYELTEEEMV
jgi:hypothetical protein